MSDPQLWVSVVEQGCFFGMLALAYYVVLIGAGFFNFAVGPYAMVGGLATSSLVLNHGFSLWPAVIVTILGTMALAAVTEIVVVRPVQRRSRNSELPALIAVAAVLFTIEQLAGYLFGRTQLPGQRLVTFEPVTIGSATIQPNTIVLVGVTIVVFLIAGLLIRFSRTGRLLRAVGDNRDAAGLLGLPVSRVRITAFLVCGLIAAVTGLLFAPKAGVNSLSGLDWTISGFLALVVGGTGSVFAPLIGGLLLGLIQVFVPYYFGGASESYGLLAVALVFFALKPEGLFMRRVRA